ncbi:hypothetical protein DQ04_01261030 [Trypanosoma grayi]|uniref:hypothetical protein n=1 Tax=Trypanosoma grayi TaxID=71804 RepID=UPI0004F48AA0|nr:hypothetical protein DQ04_01261030 [Trypanosoma grayi]KEG13022.1 hypothetical protein DQ04_01261030 [Trypanosoma grayi]
MQQQRPPRAPWGQVNSSSARQQQQQSSALLVRPANVPRPAFTATKATPRRTDSVEMKGKRSAFEVAYEESLAQLALLQQKLEQQAAASLQLERNTLEYYYTNAICFESYDGERVPQQNSGWHHYYFTSVISHARRERRERRMREELQIQDERRRVQVLEDDVRERILKGALEEQRGGVAEVEADNNTLQQHLAQRVAEGQRCRECLQQEQERQTALQQQRMDCEARIRKLEAGKREQMENADATRLQVCEQRAELAVAQAELQRREKVVSDLREAIGRLTRKRRQRG